MKQNDHTKNLRRIPIRTGKFAFLFVCWCLLLGGGNPGLLMAQNIAQKIEGTVLDQGKQPVVGATVLVKNTSVATTTRKDGFFAITAKTSDILVVSSIGYQTEEVKITDPKQKITVTLKEDVIGIADVVVSVGYGQQRHRDVTGSVGVVPLNDILKAPVVSFDQALQGRIAGVNISSADGQPGTEMDIVIRGSNSLTQSNSPLYVVDGFPLDDFSSAAINQSDIASISILKDASSTAIYGSRGANGVIIIETKQGKEGRPVVQYNGTYGFQKVTRTMDMMNPYEFVRYQIELNANNADIYLTNEGRTLDDYKQIKGIDWQDRMFHLAPMHMHNLSLSGGTRQTRYNISFGATDQQGVIRWSGYQKYQGRISFTQQINDKIRAIASVSYTEDKTYGQTSSASLSTNNAYSTFLMYRTWAYRPVLVSGQSEEDLFDDDMNVGVMNPVISNRNEDNTKKVRTFFSNLRLEYSPIKELKLMIRGGYTKRNTRNEQFNNSQTYQGYPSPNNNVGVNANYLEITKTDWVNENTLTYTKRINHDHNFDVMVGMTLQNLFQPVRIQYFVYPQ